MGIEVIHGSILSFETVKTTRLVCVWGGDTVAFGWASQDTLWEAVLCCLHMCHRLNQASGSRHLSSPRPTV